jgi:SAM-dependent methyltransferase
MNRRDLLLALPLQALAMQYEESKGDVPWVPTPDEVIDAMLRLAGASARDTVIDLGSGDGRVLIYAAKKFGCRGVGVEIERHRVAEARQAAKQAKVERLVRFETGNFYHANVSRASIVFLYLFTAVMTRLKPKLLAELRPGTRVVAYQFNGMGDWKPERTITTFDYPIYLWTVPGTVPGRTP